MNKLLCLSILLAIPLALTPPPSAPAQQKGDERTPFFDYVTATPTPRMITYSPSQLDPRQEANQRKLTTSSIRADLEKLRPTFDGLILYGYHESCTPRVVAVAKDLKFKAILLAIWDPKSTAEVDGVAALAQLHHRDFALGVLVGNEGITFKRYEAEDLLIAAARLRAKLPKGVPLATGEPLVGYDKQFVRDFGDFLAPNIHPVFDRPKLEAEPAAAWAREEATKLARLTKKPVLLKETGFPHGGKGTYTPAAQQAFWAAYVKPGLLARPTDAGGAWVYHGVAFDAFDLPWKVADSKLPIEGSWGLFSPQRVAHPALTVWQGQGK